MGELREALFEILNSALAVRVGQEVVEVHVVLLAELCPHSAQSCRRANEGSIHIKKKSVGFNFVGWHCDELL